MNHKNILQEALFVEDISYAEETSEQQKQPIKDIQPFQVLDNILIESAEQTKINKTREVLNESAKNISDEQLETFCAQFDYLLNCWLDSFETQLFDGKTLREISDI